MENAKRVKAQREFIDFGDGKVETVVFYPKNKLITREQRLKALKQLHAKENKEV